MKLLTTRDEPMTRLNLDDFEHDALAAHALFQAISEWWDRPQKDHSCTDAAVTWIECRADELMREWTVDMK